ncbi:MAG: nucleotidyltransferase domain-containing protein [Anaerolineae bacterium]
MDQRKRFRRVSAFKEVPEMENDSELIQTLIERFVQRTKEAFGDNLVSIVLYGSVARDDYRPDSDIDLLLVFEELPRGAFARRNLISPLEQEIEREVPQRWEEGQHHGFTTILKTREEAKYTVPYYLDMTTDAILLYDKGDFFKGVLDRLRARMEELGSKKVYIGDKWYWDLKPDSKFGEVIEL